MAPHRPNCHLVLVSQSPRRRELLAADGIEFTIALTQISEIPDENLNLLDQIREIARQKAESCLKLGLVAKGQRNLLLSADTVVVLGGQILGKPESLEVNRQYLRRLSGQAHSVITALCLVEVDTGREVQAHEISEVRFRQLTDEEIAAYVSSGEGLDKAGGYGIQSAEAGRFVESLSGPLDNVIGLPIALLKKILQENHWNVERRNIERRNP